MKNIFIVSLAANTRTEVASYLGLCRSSFLRLARVCIYLHARDDA